MVGCLAFLILLFVIYLFTISVFLGIGAIVLLIIIYYIGDKLEKRENESIRSSAEEIKKLIEEHLAESGFSPTHAIFSSGFRSYLAIDEETKRLAYVKPNVGLNLIEGNGMNEYELFVLTIPYHDILESYITENGISVTKTSRSSQIGSALIGGLVAGGVGAVIGGLSGKTQTSDKIKEIKLQIVINHTESPILDIIFYIGEEIEKYSNQYNQLYDRANHWHKLISVLIHQADVEDEKNHENVEISLSSTDQLIKLAELYREGLITKEEFEAQKKTLM